MVRSRQRGYVAPIVSFLLILTTAGRRFNDLDRVTQVVFE